MANWTETAQLAKGRWQTILPSLTGVNGNVLTNKAKACPLGCGGTDKFRFDDKDGNGTYYCNSCGAGNGFHFVQKMRGLGKNESKDLVAEYLGIQTIDREKYILRVKTERLISVNEKAIYILQEGKKTLGQIYLNKRGIKYEHDFDELGFHPGLEWNERDENASIKKMGIYPAIIANFSKPNKDGEYINVGQSWIYLTKDGEGLRDNSPEKKKVKKFLSAGKPGYLSGAAVHLDSPHDLKGVLGVAEGLETTLYVREATKIPMWSCGTAQLLEKVIIPESVNTVYIFGDNDDQKESTGEKSSNVLAKRLVTEGKKVKILIPEKTGDDWLDDKTLTRKMVDEAEFITTLDHFYPEPLPISEVGCLRDILPEETLPKILQPWVKELSECYQVPLVFPAAAAIILIATAIGSGCAIKPKRKDQWFEFANLYGILVAYPSDKKSALIKEIFKVLFDLEDQEEKRFEKAMLEYGSKCRLWEEKKDELQKKKIAISKKTKLTSEDTEIQEDYERQLCELELEPPDKPLLRTYVITDTTPEAFVELNKNNKRGFVILPDELISLFKSFQKEGREALRQDILSCFGGGYSSQARIGSPRKMKDAYISILGGMQPDILIQLMRSEGRIPDGMMTRFQMVFLTDDREKKSLDTERNPETGARIAEMIKNFIDSGFREHGAISDEKFGRPYFTLDDDAYMHFMDWEKEILQKQRGQSPQVRAVLGRKAKLLLSLVLIFHLAMVYSKEIPKGPVTEKSFVMAHYWLEIVDEHAKYIEQLASGGNIGLAMQALMNKCRYGELKTFTVAKLLAYGWENLDASKKDAVYDVIFQLEQANWLLKKLMTGGKNGSFWEYEVNPRVVMK